MINIRISYINAGGLSEKAIDDILYHCKETDLLFITETWLLPNHNIPTNWTQYHTYAEPVQSQFNTSTYRGQMGISLLINPDFQEKHNIYINTQNKSKYVLTSQIKNLTMHCVYLPPTSSLNDEEAYTILDSLNLTTTTQTIICGDFNARLGNNIMGDTRWNSRGSKFMKWIKQHSLINLNKTLGQHGVPTFIRFKNNQVETSIVDYFITTTELTNATMEIKANLSFSDHKMIRLSFDLDTSNTNDDVLYQRKQWCINKLKDDAILRLYFQTTTSYIQDTDIINKLSLFLDQIKSSQAIQDSPDTKESIEYYTNIIYDDIIYKALDTALGNKEYRNKNWKWFWSKELQHTANIRQHYYNKWIHAYGITQKCKWWDLYIKQQAKLKQEVKQARNRSYFDFVDRIDQARDGDPKTIKRILKSKGNNQQSKFFTSSQGPQHATDQMCDFFESIYDGKYIANDIQIQPRIALASTSPEEGVSNCNVFTQLRVRNAICRLPNNKAPGCDHIIAEHLKPIQNVIAPVLLLLFTVCWHTGYTPQQFRSSQVIPIFKKGDKDDPANYRPIALTSHIRKLMEYCLQQPLYDTTSIHVAQGGFKPQLSAIDQSLCLDTLIKAYKRDTNTNPTIVFMDIQKAYDQVDRKVIWKHLIEETTTPIKMIQLLQNLFDDVQIQIINNNRQSRFFQIKTGCLQGSCLSPHLYSIFINSLPQLLNTTTNTRSLLFADDVAALGSEEEIHNMLTTMETHSQQLGYRWSPTKCRVIKAPTPTIFKIYNQIIPETESFPYLGVPFNNQGIDPQQFLETHHQKALTSMQPLHHIGARSNAFSLPTTAKLYMTFIRPKIEYSLCIQNFSLKQLTRLERVQDDCLRLVINGHRNCSMKAFKVMLNIPTMQTRWFTLNTKYLLRLQTLPSNSLVYQLHQHLPRYHRLKLLENKNTIYNNYKSQISTFDNTDNQTTLYHDKHLLKDTIDTYRIQLINNASEVTVQACLNTLTIDPIFKLPMTRRERRRLLRYKMNWLPGRKITCLCGGEMSRKHILICPAIPEHYWSNIQRTQFNNTHPFDAILKKLPQKKPTTNAEKTELINKWKPLWSNLLHILLLVDEICIQPPQPFELEENVGELLINWILK